MTYPWEQPAGSIADHLGAINGDGPINKLEAMSELRIFSVTVNADRKTAEICEACDGYFRVDLTKDELAQLGRELIHLSRDME